MCHHVYSGETCDADEFSVALERICRMLDENKIERESVTLVFDKGSASLPNTVELENSRTGWISALPWNQAPEQLRIREVEKLSLCSNNLPGVRAAAEKTLVHGKEYLWRHQVLGLFCQRATPKPHHQFGKGLSSSPQAFYRTSQT